MKHSVFSLTMAPMHGRVASYLARLVAPTSCQSETELQAITHARRRTSGLSDSSFHVIKNVIFIPTIDTVIVTHPDDGTTFSAQESFYHVDDISLGYGK